MGEFEVKGWCPSALRPMMSGDGLVVRITPPMARLTQAQVKGLAQAADIYGNGLIDLSARGNLQLRGVRESARPAVLTELTALGLLDYVGPNIVVSPYWTAGDGTGQVYDALTGRLSGLDAPQLPDKFGFAIALSPNAVLHPVSADIRIEWHRAGILVRPDSFMVGALVQTAEDAAEAARELAQWFLASGGAHGGRGRMAGLWPGDSFSSRQAHLPQAFRTGDICSGDEDATVPGPHPLGLLAGLEFGQITSAALAALAAYPLRFTPWRMVLLEGCSRLPGVSGLITDAGDPRLRVSACTGAPMCPQGLQPVRDLARKLAREVPLGKHLHVSGCAKGCAHPTPADMTLCATRDGFSVIRGGRASDPPEGRYDASTPLFKAPS